MTQYYNTSYHPWEAKGEGNDILVAGSTGRSSRTGRSCSPSRPWWALQSAPAPGCRPAGSGSAAAAGTAPTSPWLSVWGRGCWAHAAQLPCQDREDTSISFLFHLLSISTHELMSLLYLHSSKYRNKSAAAAGTASTSPWLSVWGRGCWARAAQLPCQDREDTSISFLFHLLSTSTHELMSLLYLHSLKYRNKRAAAAGTASTSPWLSVSGQGCWARAAQLPCQDREDTSIALLFI